MRARRSQKSDSYVEIRVLPWLLIFALAIIVPLALWAADNNGDNLDDTWEAQYGISTNAYDATNLVGWWQLNGTNNTDAAVDRSGNGLTGTLTNFPTAAYGAGLFSNALVFPSSGAVGFPTTNSVLNVPNGFTFSSWFQTGSTNATLPTTIVTWQDASANGWSIGTSTNGVANITLYDGATQTVVQGSTGTVNLYDGGWHQVAATVDTNQVATIYVDGEAEASNTVTGWSAGPVSSFTFGATGTNTDNNPFNLDEVRLYNRAMGGNEIPRLPATYSDLNGSGLSVLQDEQENLNPRDTNSIVAPGFASSGLTGYYGANSPTLTTTAGDQQVIAASTFGTNALVVHVTDSSNNPLTNAPVTFSIASGSDGLLSETSGGATANSLSLTTDGSGNATVYYESGPDALQNNTVTATAVSQAGSVSVNFTERCGVQANLVAWLDADTGVTADGGGNVSAWNDQSPSGNSATQGTSGIQPALVTSSLNSHAVIRFDGVGTYLSMPPAVQDDFTMVVVFRSTQGSGSGGNWYSAGGIVDGETSGVVNDLGMSLDPAGEVLTGIGNPDTSVISNHGGYNDGRGHIATFIRTESSGSFSQYLDSVYQSSQSGNTGTLNSPPQFTIGATQTLAQYFGGDVAEVLLYQRNLSSDEQAAIEGFLADKYGLYSANATWPEAYSGDVQAQITTNQWTKAQADAYVALSGGSPSVPEDGLMLWLTAATGVSADGSGNVLQWQDQSAFGHILSQTSNASNPVVQNDAAGNPTLRFDGNQALFMPDYVPINGDLTFISVASVDSASNFQMFFGAGSPDYNTSRSYNDGWGSMGLDTYYSGAGGGPMPNSGVEAIATVTYSRGSGDANFYLQGNYNGYGNVSTYDLTSGFIVGNDVDYSAPFTGNISEILVYNRILSNAERTAAEGYLADQYGIYTSSATWPLAYSADVQAMIVENAWSKAQADSYVASLSGTVGAVTLSPVPGHYASTQTVTATSDTSDATIYYTTDGSTPTTGSSSISNGGTLTVSATSRFRFLAADGTNTNSPLTSAVYLIGNLGQLVAGDSFTMVNKPDGSVWTWGDDGRGQEGDNQANNPTPFPQQVTGFGSIVNVAAAGDHALAVDSSGGVWSWGADDQSQGGDGGTNDLLVPTQITSLSNIASVWAGSENGFAVDSSGNLYGWGNNDNGQLGDGTYNGESTPEAITSVTNVTKVISNPNFTIVLKSDGTVWATGSNYNGALGDGTYNDENIFQQVPNLTNVVDIAAGFGHVLALRSDGTVFSWGYNWDGELGNGNYNGGTNFPAQIYGLPAAVAVEAVDSKSFVVLGDGTLRCFGGNGQGNLGMGAGNNDSQATPIEPPGVHNVAMLAAGTSHTVICTSAGTLFGWGDNSSYRLTQDFVGNNFNTGSEVHDLSWGGFTSVASAGNTTIALKNDGTVWAVGEGDNGTLGNGSSFNTETPVPTSNLSNITKIAGGNEEAYAIDSSGTLWAWGPNWSGQLGVGSTDWQTTPVQVSTVSNVTAVAAGDGHMLAVQSDGTVWAVGDDSQGELGDGTNNQETTPIQVTEFSNATQVAGGSNTSFVLDSSGAVWAFGQNDSDQLGLGYTGNVSSPTQITTLPTMVAIAACGNSGLGIDSSGNVWTWGQIGNSDGTPYEQPGFTGATAVAAGNYHGIVLKSDGTVWGVGAGWLGQLGNNGFNGQSNLTQFNGVIGATGLSASYGTSVIVKNDGSISGFGTAANGEFGANLGVYSWTPRPMYGIAMSETAPTVSLTAPAAAATVNEGSAIDFQASASASTGSIKKVVYYLNGVNIGSSTSGGNWDVSWTPTTSGDFTFEAVAYDTAGVAQVSAPVTVLVWPNIAPTGPSNVTVTTGPTGTVYIGWTNGSGASSVLVQQQNGDGSWTTIGTLGAGATSFTVTGLDPSNSYNFQVVEENGSGNTSSSVSDSSGSSNPPVIAQVSGDNQIVAASTFEANPLVVSVADSSGNPLAGVSVLFSLGSGSDGGLATTSGGTVASTQTVTTNAQGQATIYYQSGSDSLKNNSITAATDTGDGNVSVGFTARCGAQTGLAMWLSADSGVTQDGSGNVTSWADETGNYTVTQSGSSEPSFVSSDVNGEPALRFNGSQFMSSTSDMGLNSGMTMVTVAETTVPGQNQYSLYIGALSWGQGRSQFLYNGSDYFDAYGAGCYGEAAPPAGTFVSEQTALDSSLSTVTFSRNGTEQTTGGVSGLNNPGGGIAVGAYPTGGAGWVGDIAEVLVYDHPLSADEIIQVDGYLSDKYGYYSVNASWPEAYSSDVQTLIAANQWTKAQADAYVAFLNTSPPVPASGLTLWLKADAGVTADGSGNVSEWADQSPVAENAAQSNSGNQPQIVSNALNGEPVMRFNGSSAYLQMPAGFTQMSSGVSVFAVFNPSTTASYERIFDLGNGSPSDNIIFCRASNESTFEFVTDTGAGNSVQGGAESVLSTPQEYSAILNGTSAMTLYQNGTQVGQVTSGLTAPNNIRRNTDYIGKSNWGGDPLFQGDMAEILIYNRPLTDAERDQVEGYLADKYGLYNPNSTWPSTYSSDVQAEITANQWNKAQADAYVAFVASSPPVPAEGLSLWLKADSGVTADGSGNVSQWTDQGVNGFVATQSNGSNEPVLVANASNSEPALQFSGGQTLQGSGNLHVTASGGTTVIAVDTTTAPGDQRYLVTAGGSSVAGQTRNMGYEYGEQTLSTTSHDIGGGDAAPGTGVYVVDAATLATDGTDIAFYRNGVETGTATTSGTDDVNPGFSVGSYVNNSINWEGNVAEVLVYNRVLTGDEMNQVMVYLADKYGLYNTSATWPLAYSSDVQALITTNQWSKAQADAYVAFQASLATFAADNPNMVTDGLVAWLSSDTNVTSDSSGNVSAWGDRTPYANNANQGTVGNEPQLVTSVLNGKPVLRFNGSSFMSVTDNSSLRPSAGVTVISVATTHGTADQDIVSKYLTNNAWGWDWLNPYYSYELGTGSNDVDRGYLTTSDNESGSDIYGSSSAQHLPAIRTLVYDGTNQSVYREGTLVSSQALTGTIDNGDGNERDLFIGASGWTPGGTYNYLNGDVAEVLVYNRALTSDEQQQVELCLANKYGLYYSGATWISSYSSGVQSEIVRNGWSKAQADAYVAFVAANPDLPATGLSMWLKADTNVTSSGGYVSQWGDSGFLGNNANQSNSGNQPTLVASAVNGKPAIQFDGSSSYLDVTESASIHPTSAVTIIAVAQTNGNATQDIVSTGLSYNAWGWDWLSPYYAFELGVIPGDIERGYVTTDPGTVGNEADATGGDYNQMDLMTMTYDGSAGAMTIYRKGQSQGSVAAGTNIDYSDTTQRDLIIGATSSIGIQNYLNGQVAEVLVYNRALTDAERQGAEGYLADKYGLSSPNATWPEAYSSDVQALITANGWNKAQADAYVAFAAGQTSVPSSGLVVWLEADEGVTTDGSGNVSQWTDQGPLGNSAVQSSAGNRPHLLSSALNGKPMLQFDGSTSYMSVTDTAALHPAAGVTIIAVGQVQGSGSQDVVAKAQTRDSESYGWQAPYYSYDLGTGNNDVEKGYVTTGAEATGTEADAAISGFHQAGLMTMVYDGTAGSESIYRQGQLQTTQSAGATLNYEDASERDLTIGANAGDGIQNYLQGNIAEVLVYNRALSDTERQQAEGYLADKYGVYSPAATWPNSYTSAVQAEIARNQWTKAQTDAYVAFVATSPAVPTTGLAAWYKAGSGVTADGSGKVSAWADQGPLANNAGQATSGNQPTLVSDSLNGLPVVQFDGSSSYLTVPETSSLHPPSGVTIVAVGQVLGTGVQDLVAKALTHDSESYGWQAPYYSYELGTLSNDVERGYVTTDPNATGSEADAPVSDFHQSDIMTMSYDSQGSVSIYRRGLLQQVVGAGATLNYQDTSERDLVIGANAGDGIQNYLNGNVAEVLVYNRTLSDTERQQAEGYLADTYGLYSPNATWPEAYSVDVQAEITRNEWNKAQADAYVAFQSGNSTIATDGLLLWFKADAGVTQDGSGNVSQWTDQASGEAVTQGTTASMPTYVSSDSNGEPALHFSGAQTLGSSAGLGVGLNQDVTVIAVTTTTAPSAAEESLFLGDGSTAGGSRGIGYNYSEQFADFAVTFATGAPAPSTSFVTEAYTVDSALQNVTFYRNGIATFETTASNVAGVTNGITVGNRIDGSAPWQGDIAELLVYNHQLSTDEMNQVGGYLGDKYGIYNPNATWPTSYSTDVQARIAANQWTKAQADAYVAAHPSTPAVVSSGLAMWLKADTGVTQDGSGNVTAWADQAGSNNVAQGTGSNEPSYISSDVNGKPALRFNGSQWLYSSNNLGLNADVTVIAVGSTTAPSAAGDSVYLGTSDSETCRGLGYSSSTQLFDVSGSSVAGAASPAANTFVTEEATLDTDLASVVLYRNGVQTATGTVTTAQNLSAGITVGANNNGTSAGWQGDVAEVLVYDHKLSAADLAQVDGYLADKYGFYDINASWPSTYSYAVEVEIFKHQWNKAQADQYVALQTNNPSMLTNGLTMWVRADSGVTTSGSNVTAVTDLAENNTLSQGTSANQPTLVSSDVNSQPALRFAGSQWLSNATVGLTGLDQDSTIITVAMTTTPSAQGYSVYLGTNSGTAGANRAVGYSGGGEWFDTTGSVSGGAAPTAGTFVAEETTLDPTVSNVTFYQNGLQTSAQTLTGVTSLSSGIALGAASDGSSPWQGDIAEVLVYDHQLSPTELQQVQTYLIDRYGLAGNAAAPTISPAAGNYSSTQSVTISTTLTSGTIHYTIDGTTPNAGSPTYSSAISVSASALVQAAVFNASGQRESQMASSQFYINDTGDTGLAGAPTGLTVTTISGKEVDLAWTDASFLNYSQIYVYRSTNGGAYQLISVLDPSATSFNDTTVTGGNTYTYEIGTTNQSGTSLTSASSSVNPTYPTPVTISVTTPSGAIALP